MKIFCRCLFICFMGVSIIFSTATHLKAEWFLRTSIPHISTLDYPFISGVAVINDFEGVETLSKDMSFKMVLVENGNSKRISPHEASSEQWAEVIEQIDKNTVLVWFKYKSYQSKNSNRSIRLYFDTNGFQNLDGEEFYFRPSNRHIIVNSMDYIKKPPSYERGQQNNEKYKNKRIQSFIDFNKQYKSLNNLYCWELLDIHYSSGTKLKCRFEKVRVRNNPNLSSETITFLKSGEVVESLGNNGGKCCRAELRGKIYFSRFVKIKTNKGKEGWVFIGALEK